MNIESITTYAGCLSANGTSGMPFLRQQSYTLTIAITAALLVQYQPAFAKQNGWNCKKSEETWDCSSTIAAPQEKAAPITEAEPTHNNSIRTTGSSKQTSLNSPAEPKIINNYKKQPPLVKAVPSLVKTTNSIKKTETKTTNAPNEETSTQSVNIDSQSLPDSPYAHLGWQPYLDNEGAPNHCSGRYIEPPLPEDDGTPFQLLPILVDAAEAKSELGQGTTLSGSVKIVQGSRSLYSNSATINQETGDISLVGGATYREPGLLFTGKTAESNTNSQKTILNDAEYVLYENSVRGSVSRISRNEDATITIKEGDYTQCPPNTNTWKVSAKEIHLNKEEGFGWAKHATLRVSDVPVLYVPYFHFPIDDRRHSGFLYPSIGYSDTEGLDLTIPYYFNIAANIDDTFSPRFLEKRGFMLENEFRYMNSYSLNSLSTSYLPDDNITGKNRWLLGIQHSGTPNERWRSKIDYLSISDNNYFDDLGTRLDITQESHLNQSGALSYYGNQWQAEFLLQSYQTIDVDNITPYRRLPQFQISGSPSLGSDWLSANYLLQLTQFDRDLTGLTGSDRITGSRLHAEPELSATFRSLSGYIKPSIKLWHSQYSLNNQLDGLNDSPSVTAPVISIDSGLFFDRDFTLLGNTYQQTLEPRLYALYVSNQNQSDIPDFDTTAYSFDYASLFRSNRFSGYDRIGDTQQLSLGVTSRLIDKKGREAVTASIGQAIYFDDRFVDLGNSTPADSTSNYSDIATSATWRPNRRMNINFNANFNHEDLQNTENNLSVRYQEDINRIISFSYRFSDDVREQSTASFIWPISKSWSTLGVWQYDWLTNDNIDTALGFEYESCCWKTRIITRQWLKDNDEKDTALYLQFVLKGLGSFGSSGSTDFIEKITGFEQREEINDQF
ncbi:LPS-assembly protein LptD [Neptunomonas sp.]|uniref:LPS-assembly protein LptD n=1 Tax=Neptunomonas sp. TaxID=1971898 RepID=UPI0026007D21|nr:LPS-assembly protein LptD [Neptunomonas sp.]